MADTVQILISVEPSRARGVEAALRQTGVTVDEVLEDIGSITARCSEADIASVSNIPGVLGVDRQRSFKLPSPGSPVQ